MSPYSFVSAKQKSTPTIHVQAPYLPQILAFMQIDRVGRLKFFNTIKFQERNFIVNKLITLIAVGSILTGCGGGGGSSSNTVSPIDKYVGSWKNSCYQSNDIFQASDNQQAHAVDTITLAKLSDTTANIAIRTTAYAASDSTCSGSSIGSVVKTGETTGSESSGASGVTSSYGQNLLTYNAEATLSDGKKVDQFTFAQSKLSNISAIITAGQIKLNTADFSATTVKSIIYSLSASKIVFNSNSSYPTVLDEDGTTTFTKQ